MSAANDIFSVITHDDHGQPARCSYCPRVVKRVVMMPLTGHPGLEERIRLADGGQRWLGLCAFCVLDMAKALQAAEEKR